MKGVLLGTLAYAGQHYMVVDPTSLNVCNILQTRLAFSKLAALLFNSDSLSGNTGPTHQAMKNPAVWKRVNSQSTPPSTLSMIKTPTLNREADCDDIDRLIEVATTVGAGFASGELSSSDLSETVQELVDSNIQVLNITALPQIKKDDLRAKYWSSSVTTPLVTILPSCEKPWFPIPANSNYDWNKAIGDNARGLVADLFNRLDNCGDCGQKVLKVFGDASGVQVSEDFFSKMTHKARLRVDELLASTEKNEIPSTLGGVLAFFIRQASQGQNLQAAASQQGGFSEHAESVVAFLDALSAELINGPGPVMAALDDFYKAMGCI